MKNRKIWLAGVGAGAVGAAALIGTLAFAAVPTASAGNAVLGGDPPQLSALTAKATSADALPASILELPVADHFLDPSLAREVGKFGDNTYYLIPGTGDTVCLLFVGPDLGAGTPESAGTCSGLTDAVTSGVYLIGLDSSGTSTVAVVAPDGISTVRAGGVSAKVANNVAVFTTRDASSLELVNGSLKRSSTIDTGPAAPTELAPAD